MEQDIEILERMLKIEKECLHYDVSQDEIRAIEHLIKAYKELKEENRYLKTHIIYPEIIELNFIPVSLVEEKLKKEKLPNIIVGGRRNGKALEYGKKLGRIEMCEELLERRK